jgi:hypothetical protein
VDPEIQETPKAFRPRQQAKKPKGALAKACGCLSLDFWSGYFQINQTDILNRLTLTLNPTAPTTLFSEIAENPDFYGPIWVMNLLIFSLSVCSNFFHLLRVQLIGGGDLEYDFSKIGFSITMVYGAFALFTGIFVGMSKVLGGGNMNLFQVACIYGYSFSYFAAACMLSIIPIEFIRALIWIGAGAASTFMLLKNFKEYVESREGNAKTITLAVIAVFQVVLTFTFWLKFF